MEELPGCSYYKKTAGEFFVVMNLRRAFILSVMLSISLLSLIFQLMLVQLFGTHKYMAGRHNLTAAAVQQRMHGIVLDDGRGRFIDRFGRPLTGFTIRALAVEPHALANGQASQMREHSKLLKILGMTEDEWLALAARPEPLVLWERDGYPVALTDEQTASLEKYPTVGLQVVPWTMRYEEPFYASHLIGFISQHPERLAWLYEEEIRKGSMRKDVKIGASGLELSFERLLRSRGAVKLGLFTDALRRPLDGMEQRLVNSNPAHHPLYAETTLDLDLQAQIEQLLDHRGIRAASVVLLDAKTADVLVMANRPNYDPLHPDPRAADWSNRAIRAQVPGSIFKIVIAAAALEYRKVRPHEAFICNGEYGKYGFRCWKPGGHGRITFREAFAKSCNIAFAHAALRLTPQQIEQTADALGVGRLIGWREGGSRGGWRHFMEEEAGRIFNSEQVDEGVLIQTAIGQRDVRLTPLQAANLVATLLNGGKFTSPRVVSTVKYRDGGIKKRYPVQRIDSPHISRVTAGQLLSMMEEVVLQGTATSLRGHSWRLAGKTGTAELGDHSGLVNQWFVGYGPVERPQITAAVVLYSVPHTADSQAVDLFAEIMEIVREVYEARADGLGDVYQARRMSK